MTWRCSLRLLVGACILAATGAAVADTPAGTPFLQRAGCIERSGTYHRSRAHAAVGICVASADGHYSQRIAISLVGPHPRPS